MEERLQKFLSQAGVASRRHAEQMIVQGLVKVNGKKVTELGTKVDPEKDRVEVANKLVKVNQLMYFIFNKPKRCVTTRHDPQRRKTIFAYLPEELKNKVWPVGRLDFNTEGLIILTNDGDLTQQLTHPSKEHEREYEVVLDKPVTQAKLDKLTEGVWLQGKKTSPAKVRQGSESVIYLTIHEGWNRQVRRMFAVLGFTVRNLKRVRVGKLKLGNLPPGEYKKVSREELA